MRGTDPNMDAQQAAKLGAQVRRARRAHDWTQAQLADEAGVAGGTIVRIETGKNVRPGNLRAVLDALDIPPLSESSEQRPTNVQTALDVVENWLISIDDPAERDNAVMDLVRYATLRHK